MNKRIMKKHYTPSKKMLKKLGSLEKGKRTISVTRLELSATMAYKARTGLRRRCYLLVVSSTGKLFLVKQEARRRGVPVPINEAQKYFGSHAHYTLLRV